jgi:alpha-L-rhamnosidase
VTANGRLVSDSQTAYSLFIVFGLYQDEEQKSRAGQRLAQLVIDNLYKIGTGFAGTPFVCEALAQTGFCSVAAKMLLNHECPSWLYQVKMGATTMWERWDSMLADGSINPGEMTSFNHYAFASVATFLHERAAGLQCLEAGWRRSSFAPSPSDFQPLTMASTAHLSPFGRVAGSWELVDTKGPDSSEKVLHVSVTVPAMTEMDVVLPDDGESRTETVRPGEWSFTVPYKIAATGEPKLGFWQSLISTRGTRT